MPTISAINYFENFINKCRAASESGRKICEKLAVVISGKWAGLDINNSENQRERRLNGKHTKYRANFQRIFVYKDALC